LTDNKHPLSISTIALIFLALVFTLFSAVGFYGLSSIQKARENIGKKNHEVAREELIQALNHTFQTINSLEKHIAQWDELFQQLENPSYYSYWHNHRLFTSDNLPKYITSAEVFNPNGDVLAILSGSKFDNHIDTHQLPNVIKVANQSAYIEYFLPIKRPESVKIEGYLGLRIPLITALHSLNRFSHIQQVNLKPALPNQKISLENAAQLITYNIKTYPEVESMMDIISSSVIQLATIVGLLCMMFYFLVVYLLGKPLVRISEYIDQLSYTDPGPLGNGSQYFFSIAELEKVRTSLNQYHLQLKNAYVDLDEKNQELWKQAHHDPLTGVLNRRAFDIEWKKSKDLLKEHRLGIGIILFDINRFKAINDTYGHQTGDEVLRVICNCIIGVLRKGEKLFRIGGDEFSIIIIDNDSIHAQKLGERCIQKVDQYDFTEIGIKEKVRISCGISHSQADKLENLDLLQAQADIAVYQAKRPGINHPVLFSKEMSEGAESVFSSWVIDAVYNAVTSGHGIEMHYQPIVNTQTKQTDYFESLLRIRHAQELIPPSHIFPIIAQHQWEVEMDRIIIKSVVKDLDKGFLPDNCGISINISAESIAHKNLVEWLLPLADFTQTHYIVIEVTETSLISQMSSAVKNLKLLRKKGFKIALDDFGSGYSSLRYLTNMPVDIIKFDISLIQGMSNKRLGKLVHELALLLNDLNYELVAEGIENITILKKIQSSGFKYAQGFLFGMPIRDPDQISNFIHQPFSLKDLKKQSS
jgi:diguanylate cyclase (GGDEF)-like protein